MSSSWIDCLSQKEREDLYINFWKYKNMSHDEICKAIIGGLHFLTTTDLVGLHSEISRVQIEHSHENEIEKENG